MVKKRIPVASVLWTVSSLFLLGLVSSDSLLEEIRVGVFDASVVDRLEQIQSQCLKKGLVVYIHKLKSPNEEAVQLRSGQIDLGCCHGSAWFNGSKDLYTTDSVAINRSWAMGCNQADCRLFPDSRVLIPAEPESQLKAIECLKSLGVDVTTQDADGNPCAPRSNQCRILTAYLNQMPLVSPQVDAVIAPLDLLKRTDFHWINPFDSNELILFMSKNLSKMQEIHIQRFLQFYLENS